MVKILRKYFQSKKIEKVENPSDKTATRFGPFCKKLSFLF